MATQSSAITSQVVGAGEYAGRSLGYVWNPNTLAYEVATPSSGGGGGGAATIADGADVAEGATTDAESAAGNGSVVALLKRLRTLLSNPLAVTGTFWQATQPVSGTFWQATQPVSLAVNTPDVTDRAGRLLGVIASVTAAIDVGDRAARVLGRAQILDSASAVIDPATKGQLPAALVGGRLSVDASGVAVPITDNAGSLTVDAPVGTPLFARLSDGAAALIAQKVMASSLPVVIASDQSAVATNPSDNVARLLGKIQERENGYANVALYAEAVAGIIAETAITIQKSVSYAAPAGATSNGPSAAKELVIVGIILGWVSTTTTANTARLRLRVNPGGAAIITSPIAFTMRIGWESPTFIANEQELQPILFSEKPIIIPAGGQFMATIACVAANGTLDVQLIAYERTP